MSLWHILQQPTYPHACAFAGSRRATLRDVFVRPLYYCWTGIGRILIAIFCLCLMPLQLALWIHEVVTGVSDDNMPTEPDWTLHDDRST